MYKRKRRVSKFHRPRQSEVPIVRLWLEITVYRSTVLALLTRIGLTVISLLLMFPFQDLILSSTR